MRPFLGLGFRVFGLIAYLLLLLLLILLVVVTIMTRIIIKFRWG